MTMGHFVDLTGKKFNRLVAIERDGTDKTGSVVWRCICDCGKMVSVRGSSLTNGHAKSCGCYKSDIKRTQMLGDLQPMRKAEHRAKVAATKNGKLNPQWQGGKSFEPYCPLWNEDLRRRIRAFFDYKCVTCGKTTDENKRKLSCHHISYDKQICCNGNPVRFAALCTKCHCESGMDRNRWESMLHRIIDEIYGGRSYFTKEEWDVLNNE